MKELIRNHPLPAAVISCQKRVKKPIFAQAFNYETETKQDGALKASDCSYKTVGH